MSPDIPRQQGISLLTAIFLLVVIAGLLTYLLNISGSQRGTSILNLKGARAEQAAKSGIEWAAAQLVQESTPTDHTADCSTIDSISPNFNANLNAGANMLFTVDISCSATTHFEKGTAIYVYQLESIASNGAYGSLDYVSRTLQATLSTDPP